MITMVVHLTTGLLLGALIGYLAWRARSLTSSGGVAAALTGGLIFGLGGVPWAVLLLAFFISSSALSRLGIRRKLVLSEKFSKGSQRDWGQVLANGGLGAILALALVLGINRDGLWFAFAGCMAAVNADTWATELGTFSTALPRLITNGKVVDQGTSGGITFLGYVAATGGAALIGGLAALFSRLATSAGTSWLLTMGIIILSGLVGSTVDSILGGTVQAIYYCPNCKKETERYPQHPCGTETVPLRGWHWLDNDWVNFTCSLAGSLAALGLWLLL
jgi:uncharacterized protein (TIGR00297 family)